MPTITDICKHANVSKATVSRVINGTGQVKEETRLRVEKAIQLLNYRPNSLAQALATNRSNSIGIVLSDFDGDYFGSMMKRAAKIADQTGKQLIVTDGHNNDAREMDAINFLASRRCDVIIIYSRKLSQPQFEAIQAQINVPIVLVGQNFFDSSGYTLSIDQKQVASEAMQHLIQLGHKKIGYLGPKPHTRTTIERLNVYQDSMKKNGLADYLQLPILSNGFMPRHGYETAKANKNKIKQLDALFIANDDLALGCYRMLQESNIQVPHDISVVSIDNTEKSQFVYPPLTTVDLPIHELTDRALDIALKLIDGIDLPQHHYLFSGKLIKRGSAIFHI